MFVEGQGASCAQLVEDVGLLLQDLRELLVALRGLEDALQRLEVGGLVENPLTLTWDEFLALPQAEDVSDFHCVTTWSRYDNHWRGVRFSTIAERAVPKPEAATEPAPGTSNVENVPLELRTKPWITPCASA